MLNKPVRHKLMVMLIFMAIVTAVITGGGYVAYDIYTVRQSLLAELNLLANIIGKRSAPALQFFGDQEKAKENLLVLAEKPSVVLGCLYNNEGVVLANYIQPGTKFTCPDARPALGYMYADGDVAVHQQIYSVGEKLVGTIYLRSDMREIKEHVTQILIVTAALSAGILFFAYILAYRIQDIISEPVTELTKTAQRIQEKRDYTTRAQKYYNDEIGSLAESFNAMLDEIQKQDRALKFAKDHLEEEVQKRTSDLAKALKVKSDFLSNMSHEIRTPIHGVINYADFLIKDWKEMGDEERLQTAHKLKRASGRLNELINNLLDLSKLEVADIAYDKREHMLSDIVRMIIDETEGLRRTKHIGIEFEVVGHEQSVICDRARIAQVITNLIGNAIKYSHGGTLRAKVWHGEIRTPVGLNALAVSFSISDEGVGIPEDEIEMIFEKFVESSRTRSNAGGTGIGLAISREIIQAHGGRIWAQNNAEKGSTFTFILPCQPFEKPDEPVKKNEVIATTEQGIF